MRRALFLLLLGIPYITFAQSGLRLDVGLGASFQDQIVLDGQSYGNQVSLGGRLGLSKTLEYKRNILFKGGVVLKYNRSQNEFRPANLTMNYFALQVPLYAGIRVKKDWIFLAGIGLERHEDYNSLTFEEQVDLRIDLLFKIFRHINERQQIFIFSHFNFNDSPSISGLTSPKNGVYLGISSVIF